MKKRKEAFEPINLDFLLDTLTCVAGAILIVMATTQLQAVLRKDAEKSRSAMIVTEREIQINQDSLQALEEALQALQKRWGTLEANLPQWRLEEKEITRRIDEFLSSIPNPEELLSRKLALQKELHSLLNIERELDNQNKKFQEQLVDDLDQESIESLSDIEVRIPEMREAPGYLNPVFFICRYHKVFLFDHVDEDYDKAMKILYNGSASDFSHNAEKLKTELTMRDFGSDDIRIVFHSFSASPIPIFRFEYQPRIEHGESLKTLQNTDSSYYQYVKTIDPRKNYISFFVWDDSFEVYLAARKLAEQLHTIHGSNSETSTTKLSIGWTPWSKDESLIQSESPYLQSSSYQPYVD